MKKYGILFILFICLVGCKKTSNKVTINGEIKGMGTDTIYLYGMDDSYDRIDTIPVKDGKFSYTPQVDTISCAYLLLDKQTEYPIFIDKGNKIQIKGDVQNLHFLSIDGNTYNEEFTVFQESLKGLGKPSESVLQQKAEDFIKKHNTSFVSLYLLDTYFVKKASPDYAKIKELVEVMTGVLQDKIYIERLNEFITQIEKVEVGKYAPYFNLPNAKGEKITRSSDAFKQKCILINFWASWNKDSISNRNKSELREVYRTYKKNKHIAMLGISLDIDKKQWKEAIKNDTLSWEQVCDFGGPESDIAKQYGIQKLPSTVLLDADGKVLAYDIQGEELKKKMAEVVKEAANKEKENNKKKK